MYAYVCISVCAYVCKSIWIYGVFTQDNKIYRDKTFQRPS